jgi:hypothetical protein
MGEKQKYRMRQGNLNLLVPNTFSLKLNAWCDPQKTYVMWELHKTGHNPQSLISNCMHHNTFYQLVTFSAKGLSNSIQSSAKGLTLCCWKDLQRSHAVSPLNCQMTYKDVANSVSKFGGILFTPIQCFDKLQDPWRSGFLCVARMDPLQLLNPSKNPDSYVNT